MSIVILSRSPYSRGEEIAAVVADRLGYHCVSREVLVSASEEFGVKEVNLVRAFREAPSLLGMIGGTRKRYIAYVQAALATCLEQDNVVYHGVAGHLLVPEISHMLKVRINANLEDRVRLKMAREGVGEEEARKGIGREDGQRRKWTRLVYKVDSQDPELYDMVINVGQIELEKAVELIVDTVGHQRFQPRADSVQMIHNLALSCRVKAALMDLDPGVRVSAEDSRVLVRVRGSGSRREAQIRERAMRVKGVKGVEVELLEDLYRKVLGTMQLR